MLLSECINDTCPWSGKRVTADALTRFEGFVVGFCNPGCRDKFEAGLGDQRVAIAAFREAAARQTGTAPQEN